MECLIFLMTIVSAWSIPVLNMLENPNLFRGDIAGNGSILFQGDIIRMDESERSAISNKNKRWPGGIVPYKMEGIDDLKDEIETAMKQIMDRTCIKFTPWDGLEKDYIKIFRGQGCYSSLGRIGSVQNVSLGIGCGLTGIILHELMHAIGFDHEQSRSDRDDYVVIFWQNIWPYDIDEFHKYEPSENRLINEFDYDSIMLYGEKASSKDGWSKTMKARKNKGIKVLRDVVTKGKLSESDFYRINTLYECDKQSCQSEDFRPFMTS